jgi:glycosyltransferase involved in cell wall biosynthesis
VRGADFSGALARLRFRAEYLWIRAAVARYERIAYTRADALLVNYESVRRLIDSRYGIGERCLLIPYSSESSLEEGAETTAREIPDAIARLSPPDAPLIVAVSRHDPRKGVDVLLAALRLLRHRGVPFRACLVGEGSMLAAHRSIAARAGFGESVVLTGLVPDTAPYLAAADVFVLPSRREQSGSLALIEALQAGLPVIASGVDGLLEDLRDGTDALLVAPGDAESLALALERLIGDRALREALAAEGRRTFARRFSPDAFGSALVDLYAMFGVAPQRG